MLTSETLSQFQQQNKLHCWFPLVYGVNPDYPDITWQRDFYDLGGFAKERLLMCANGVGKTVTVAAEAAMHATGLYPQWWKGYVMEGGGWEMWLGSIDNDMQKIGLQAALLGPDLEEGLGTGFLPGHTIAKIALRQAGVKEVVDEVLVRHISGKMVKLKFKTYEQGWRKWQSGAPKMIVWDEEPDQNDVSQANVHSEVLTRLVRNQGIFFGGYTPLIGETDLTRHFTNTEDEHVRYVMASWDDAPHMDSDDKERIKKAYPAHQIDARSKGIPMMGEGRIFRIADSSITIDPIPIPDHWARIHGIDFGGVASHPHALCTLAHDRDQKNVYLTDCWRQNGTLRDLSDACKGRGDWIPVAWPHDGMKRDPKSGERYKDIMRKEHNVSMLSKSARYKNDKGGSQAEWPIIQTMTERLEAGTFRVFRTCKPWLEEFRSYHTKDGLIVAARDDALKASFYALMDLRFAKSKFQVGRMSRQTSMMPFRTSVA